MIFFIFIFLTDFSIAADTLTNNHCPMMPCEEKLQVCVYCELGCVENGKSFWIQFFFKPNRLKI